MTTLREFGIERPGRPEDLPPARVLWSRWALGPVLFGDRSSGTTLDEDGELALDNGGSTCMWMQWVTPDRAVLYGEDEASGSKWHEPPVELLAGVPDWLPMETLTDLSQGDQLGFVYWSDAGTWARAPYPETLEDDGLECALDPFTSRRTVAEDLTYELFEGSYPPAAVAAVERFVRLAEERAVTGEALAGLARGTGRELVAPDQVLERARLAHLTAD